METVNTPANKKVRISPVFWLVLLVLLVIGVGFTIVWNSLGSKALTHETIVPLNGVTTAEIDIHAGNGNLTIDNLTGGEPLLAGGTLQYLENQRPPDTSVITFGDQASLSLKASGEGQPGLRLPWAGCFGATDWHIHLNPSVKTDLSALSSGGNVMLNLAGMTVTRVLADTAGGNVDVVLPDAADSLSVTAKTGGGTVTVELGDGITGMNTITAESGAGNVAIRIPESIAARIHAVSGLGKVIVDPRFIQIDDQTYQSPDYDDAADKVEIEASSGAGDVIIDTK